MDQLSSRAFNRAIKAPIPAQSSLHFNGKLLTSFFCQSLRVDWYHSRALKIYNYYSNLLSSQHFAIYYRGTTSVDSSNIQSIGFINIP